LDSDQNLLFGVLALQADAITPDRFLEACTAWAARKSVPMASLLVERGWISAEDRASIENLLRLKLRKHGGDVQASLAATADDEARGILARVGDEDIQQTLTRMPEPSGHVLVSTIAYQRETRDRYTLTRLHAQGGIGRVWLARDSEIGRDVALKELRPEQADRQTLWARFLEEARITGQLEHPGIVPVYELSKREGDQHPFYTMRFVRGRTLTEAVRAYHAKRRGEGVGPLDLQELLRAFLGVCHAVAYAHSRGVIHRDLKGQNVVLGDYGEVMVLDWGLAKVVGQAEAAMPYAPPVAPGPNSHEPTIQGQAIGTPAYMPPEQAEGRLDRIDARSDVYGLGAILYDILTGEPPFTGDDTAEVLRRVVHEEPPRPRQRDPEAPAALEAICLKALAKRPEDRYQAVSDLADDVKRFIADEPVSVYREPLSTRVTRWGRRHRTAAASVAVLLLTAVVGLSVGAVLINRERSKAEANFRQARAAVDEYFTTISESRLLNVPGLQPLRKELLDSARKYYRDFLSKRGDDPGVRAEAASASFRVGWVSQALGDPKEAMEPYQAATALYEQLVRDHPESVEYRRLLATGHGAQGLLLAGLDRIDESMAAHRKALGIREAIAREMPDDARAQIDVARTHRNMGDLHRAVGKPDEALAEWDEAIAIARPLLEKPLPGAAGRVDLTGRNNLSVIVREDLGSILLDHAEALREAGRKGEAMASWEQGRDLFESLVREQPDDLGLRARLADCYANRHSLEYDLGHFEEARRFILRSLELREAMAAANPSVLLYRRALVEGLLNLGYVQFLLHRQPEAVEAYRKAIDLAEALLAEEPDATYTKNLLAQGLTQRANILSLEGKPAEALPLARRAVDILEPIVRDQPEKIFHVSSLSNSLRSLGRAEAGVGDPARAFETYERAGEVDGSLADRYPGCRYNQACSLALMVPLAGPDRREALAAKAIEALRQAFAAGYSNAENVRIDPDLDALRDRADFRTLLADVKAGH
jgi:serine/threonine-protein kinase